MTNTIKLKRSGVASHEPDPSDLDYGELAVNYADGKVFSKNSSDEIFEIGSTSGGGESSNISSIQTDYIDISTGDLSEGGGGSGTEDASYYDIDLTQSPYASVDPDKSAVVFEGGHYNNATLLVNYNNRMFNAYAHLIDNGDKLRISSNVVKDSSSHFAGRWTIVERV